MTRDEAKLKYTYHYIGHKQVGFWSKDGKAISEEDFDAMFPRENIWIKMKPNEDKRMEWLANRSSY